MLGYEADMKAGLQAEFEPGADGERGGLSGPPDRNRKHGLRHWRGQGGPEAVPEARRAQICRFLVDFEDMRGVPLVFNIETGQVAIWREVMQEGRTELLEPVFKPVGKFLRTSAARGRELLRHNSHEIVSPPVIDDLPGWVFTRTDEPAGDWRPIMLWLRRRVRWITFRHVLKKWIAVAAFWTASSGSAGA